MQLKYTLISTLLIVLIITIRAEKTSDEDTASTFEEYYDDDESTTSNSSEIEDKLVQSNGGSQTHTTLFSRHRMNQLMTSTPLTILVSPSISSSSSSPSNLTSTVIPTGSESIDTTELIDIPICPNECRCSEDIKFLNCSNQNLTEIPRNLPNNAIRIDLSHNQLKQLNVSQLEHCADLREILLHKNQIETIIDKHKFNKFHRLDHIDLSWNSIRILSGDEFSEANELKKLSLSHNAIEIDENKPILNTRNLQILNLVDCNLTTLSDRTFESLGTLLSLDLRENPLESEINVNAFKKFSRLRSLQMPVVAQDVIHDLCKVLTAIDVINTDNYDISCFELVLGTSFEESTITVGPPTTQTASIERINIDAATTARNVAKGVITSTTTDKNEKSAEIEEPKVLSTGKQVDAISKIDPQNKTTNTSGSKPDSGPTGAQVNISPETLKAILIVTIIVAITGLLVGICCRRDCCGIKTKMCRTHRRPAPTDQVRPAEEVPLNKV